MGQVLRLENTLTLSPFIVIVEDDESLLHALVQLVRSHGYRAQGFESPERMLHETGGLAIDLVATDVQMAGMDGFELARRLREQRPGLPIIILTASNDAGLSDKAAGAGAICLLKKPLRSGQLVSWIEVALTRIPPENEPT